MLSVPMRNFENLSVRISEVLGDIGVSNETILKRRECALFREAITAVNKLCPTNGCSNILYNFGSQSEGSTTIGINSDNDGLMCLTTHHVIHDWTDWTHGVTNLLMVQDEDTAPGYCLLQLLRNDIPLAATFIPPNDAYCMYKDAKGRVLMKNTLFNGIYERFGLLQHGPAVMPPVRPDLIETDIVPAFHCEHWPTEGRRWLTRRGISGWPPAQLKLESENSGCFLVPVSSKTRGGLDELEWRISTSLAERYLMFSLNETQMGCYVLLKMFLKSQPAFQDVISSYMCKTALFHSMENTPSDFWQERNLVRCLNQSLQVLYNFIYYKNCPHFIIPENNLMAERISSEQRQSLLEVIQRIIESEGKVLYEMPIDNFGERLHLKMNNIPEFPRHVWSPVYLRKFISGELCYNLVECLTGLHARSLEECTDNVQDVIQTFLKYYVRCNQQYVHATPLEQDAIGYMIPLSCSTIGSVLASYGVSLNRPLSDMALEWLKLGLNSDVSSGWLKLATVHYSAGDIHAAEAILRHVDQRYGKHVTPIWFSHSTQRMLSAEYVNAADQIRVTSARHIVSYCVMFLRCEFNIVPHEMRQEYFRSTQEDIGYRNVIFDYWMDLAVVDSLPYLYFLQYKIYGRLTNREGQQRALHKLQQVIRDEPSFGHKETALNLLGQCMEQENLPNEAFSYYEQSLQVRPRNNAANIHMSRLLAE